MKWRDGKVDNQAGNFERTDDFFHPFLEILRMKPKGSGSI